MTMSLTSMKVELGWAGLQTPHRKRCGLWGPGVGPRYSHTHPSHAPGAPGLSALSFPPSHIYGAPLCWPLGVTRTGPVPALGQLGPIGDQASNILGASGEEQQPSLRWGSGILKNQATSLRRSVGPAVWGEGYLKVPARGLQGVWGMGALLQPPLHKLRAVSANSGGRPSLRHMHGGCPRPGHTGQVDPGPAGDQPSPGRDPRGLPSGRVHRGAPGALLRAGGAVPATTRGPGRRRRQSAAATAAGPELSLSCRRGTGCGLV